MLEVLVEGVEEVDLLPNDEPKKVLVEEPLLAVWVLPLGATIVTKVVF